MQQRHGSSPRVRGTPQGSGRPPCGCRFIPACAGNSSSAWCAGVQSAVHPRVCGELPPTLALNLRYNGSSPRVRGTPGGTRAARRSQRFIPACAGNSGPELFTPGTGGGSSPRVRGTRRHCWLQPGCDRFIPACAGNSWRERERAHRHAGSSPRVRGTRSLSVRPRQPPRFIPACAGNSRPRWWPPASHPVHPRVCGELAPATARHPLPIGSSPRVRGTRECQPALRPTERFIPACAGNSGDPTRGAAGPSVHPRVCGELSLLPAVTAVPAGSSPRVRGTRWWQAGRRRPSAVHPRVCGELLRVVRPPHGIDGSSPRVRGTRMPAVASSRWRWFIPACAGNS